jgi:hypothetical protein
MNFLEQLDEVWREIIDKDPETKKRKFNEFMGRLEAEVARLPKGQQEGALQPIIKQMAVYASLQQNDPEALKARLGLSTPSASASADRLAQAAAEPLDLMPQVDAFWREILGRDRKFVERKHREFVTSIQHQVSHLPKTEQDTLIWQVYAKNEQYSKLAEIDREALNVRLRLPASSPPAYRPASSPPADRLTQVAVETVVRATIWQSIRALFRAL